MILLTLSTFLIGAVLGLRFKVLILMPTIGLAILAIVAGCSARGHSAAATLIAVGLAVSCLQIGYFCGTIARYGRATAPASRQRAVRA
jgi:hypothetical protein